ncbi:HlyC/CorC family transporter [Reinekea marinisedimentorum]|uniref:Magnesium and cobalt efflux protein CorC n=1 Tax=Reinekea marinisedimentorum TaxID=230495 RepID=A0A4V2UJF0_9GAMM|nr:HlyC/CorC family transporter [Reinekea marinisedimentorum]TCS39820.1 Mg2+/Co2+ transporter CorB [Reinekea marinisedimentorum]
MNEFPIGLLFAILGLLLLLSAFFSSSETGMMSLNRYRLKHLANEGHRSARLASKLLEEPERLISVILIGNNLVNIAAASLSTIIAIRLLPGREDLAVGIATLLLTLVVLIFSEVTPKTLAQRHPERISFPASYILRVLSSVLSPAVWLVNGIVRGVFWLLRVGKHSSNDDSLSPEELKTIVNESSSTLPEERQSMLLGILELENVTVDDIMVPRNEVRGVDLEDNIEEIAAKIRTIEYTRFPLYKGDLDKVIGIMHIRDAAEFLYADEPSKVMLTKAAKDPYFVPENTPLHTQLINYQDQQLRMAFVVDEYGDIQGLVTLEDILEEIVGEFTTDIANSNKEIHPQRDGSFVIDGTASIRDINRALEWELPTDGPKTLNGLILEHIEDIPDANVSIKIASYLIEILQIKDNAVTAARIRNLGRARSTVDNIL